MDKLYVIARKQGNPPIYYSRQWINRNRWTAWTKIDLDIVSDHVLPIVWNRRFYLFWVVINRKPNRAQEKPKLDTSGKEPPDVKTHLEIQLAWSEFKGQKWLSKQTAPQTIVLRDPVDSNGKTTPIEPYEVTLRSTIDYPLLRLSLFVGYLGSNYPNHCAEFVLGGIGCAVEAFVLSTGDPKGDEVLISDLVDDVGPEARNIGILHDWNLGSLNPPQDSKYEAMAIVPSPSPSATMSSNELQRPRIFICNVQYSDTTGQLNAVTVLSKADFYHLVVPHQVKDFDSILPFFYEDSLRSYFVNPMPIGNGLQSQYQFIPFYHAFVPLFIRELNKDGLDALFSRELQTDPATSQGNAFNDIAFDNYYFPTKWVPNHPAEGVDFEPSASYAIYNWELFFHAPFQIGESLSLNQRFEEAKHWYEYIFNPTSSALPTSNDPIESRKPYWVTKPFYKMGEKENDYDQIKKLMDLINSSLDPKNPAIEQVNEWRSKPFDPHIIAQLRQVAYMRTIVMKYIDNLLAWGDQLFSQDTMESINEATQMYVLAAELLGPRPELVKPLWSTSDKTYEELEKDPLDAFSNAKVLAAENLLGPVQVSGSVNPGTYTPYGSGSGQSNGSNPSAPELTTFKTFYFGIPPNDKLLGYWDKVANRLFKIRHGMNIEGVKRQLALFAPPIDPGLLVRATAAGLSISDILSDTSAALPPYRFRVMVREAIELCEMVRGFGNELLGVLEKRDAEALALKRSGYEKKLQEQIKTVMQRKLDEATQQIDVLEKQRKIIIDRQLFYNQHKNELTNTWEATALNLHGMSLEYDMDAYNLELVSSTINMLPNLQFGGSGAGGSPHATVQWGSSNIASSASAASGADRITSAILQSKASTSQTIGSYQRRIEDYKLQYDLATDELDANYSQNAAAEIRQGIAQKELDNHEINVELATKVDEFLHDKYTNKELYDWMVSQTSATYFQAYHLAYTLAKRAEACFKRELGLSDSSYSPYIQFGYWDSLKKGLLAGDKLLYDLQRLKSAYYEQNKRELEITKHISLLSLDPYALVELRSTGKCSITLPEILFDMDNPGHYMRRIKSVAMTVPCVAGPYTGVSMTLTLHDNYVRTDPSSDSSSDPYVFFSPDKNSPKFIGDQGGVSSIVTSNAQNDRGMFELKFDDERYLPFECAGAISSWNLRLNPVCPQFDYSTISDVIIHLQYTARDGGDTLRKGASDAVGKELNNFALAESRKGLYRLISVRHEFGANWQKFLNPGSGSDQKLTFDIAPDRFPFFTRGLGIKIKNIDFVAKLSDTETYTLKIAPPGKDGKDVDMIVDMIMDTTVLGGLHYYADYSTEIDIGSTLAQQNLTWSFQLKRAGKPNFRSLLASEIDDLLLIVQYEVSA